MISEGQRVTKGATLFRLDSRVADVAVEHARQGVRFAEQLVQRQEQLGPGEATSQKAYQEAKAQLTTAQSELNTAEAQRRLLDVKAPLDGTVVKVNSRPGDSVDPSTLLAEVVDLSRLVVSASIRSVDAAQVKRGQRVELSPGSGPGRASGGASGTDGVEHDCLHRATGGHGNRHRHRARARATRRSAPSGPIRQRSRRHRRASGPARRAGREHRAGQGGSEVAVVQGDTAIRTPVKTGIREGTLVEVEGEGLRAGVSVVVQGAYGLPAKSKIKILGH